MAGSAHVPVLFEEALAALNIDPAGIYLDATFGRGGHSGGLLKQLGPEGRLLAMDKDLQAAEEAQRQFGLEPRFQFFGESFANLADVVEREGLAGQIDGVLMDLGVSSPQLDTAERGFSFSKNGPLDMRMDTRQGETAAEWISRVSEQELAKVLKTYGEERFSKRIAGAIVRHRNEGEISTTAELAAIIRAAVPRRDGDKDSATRSFQAIRIQVNRELEDLQVALDSIEQILRPRGRIVVISFHSLEDRLVKRALRRLSTPAPLPRKLPVQAATTAPNFKLIGKAIKASDAEIQANPRARSAIMRVAEKAA